MAADLVENYENQPAFRFIEDTPADWDDTRFLSARIGDQLAIARRSGQEWFVGAITDEVARRLDLTFDFLDASSDYVVQLYADALDTDWERNPAAIEIGTYRMRGAETLRAVLSPAGGLAMRILPADHTTTVAGVPVDELPALTDFNATADERMQTFAKIRPFGTPSRVHHAAVGCEVAMMTPSSPKYRAGGPTALVDGLRGAPNHDVNWQGFEAQDLEAVVDLGEEQSISMIGAGFLQKPAYWIFFPIEITFAISADGDEFERVAWFRPPQATTVDDFAIETFTRDVTGRKARYVRVRAKTIGACPSWHSGAGGDAWIFTDEIIVK